MLDKHNRQSIIAITLLIVVTSFVMHVQGRSLICTCGKVFFWVGDIWSANNSQHLFDPYSFTHLLHGFMFYWLLLLAAKKIPNHWQLVLAASFESIWEVVENSQFTIKKYREQTLALGYEGDAIINSISDILVCSAGFIVARYLGLKKSIVVFIVVELILLLWIKDSLILNIIMLLYPIEEIKQWQMAK